MAPKKKGGKKQADDWENDLGETPDPIAAATEQAKATEAENDDGQHAEVNGEELGGGGLLAALKKNKAKRAKKGKGGKKQPEKPASVDADSDREEGGGLKSKKEKEKEKKEREKQRKKEQVRFRSRCLHSTDADSFPTTGEEEGRCNSSYRSQR